MTPEQEAWSAEVQRQAVARLARVGVSPPRTRAESEDLARRARERVEEHHVMRRALQEHRAQRRRASS
jgi:hypothetical protein